MIDLTFPDGSVRAFDAGVTGRDVALSISKSLAKKAVAMKLDGVLVDLSDAIDRDAAIEIVTRDSADGLELIRHDCAHLMAEAVQELFPGTQVTIGPVIENGFYYDFARNEPFTPDDLVVIEKKMREIVARNAPFAKEIWDRDAAKVHFSGIGEYFKAEIHRRPARRRAGEDLSPGRLARSVPRPAHGFHRADRHRLQADEGRRCLLAR